MKFNRYAPVIIAALIFAAILFLFRLPLSRLLNTIIVTPIFASFERSSWSDIVLVLLLIITTYWVSREQVQKFILLTACFTTILYFFQRLNPYWEFIRLNSFPQLAYWDLVILSVWLMVPIHFLRQYRSKENGDLQDINNGFLEDQAVMRLEDDHFKRQLTASQIARHIKLTKNRKSFAIGILGEYGSGKTSFLNLINLEFSDTEVLKISFDPWAANNPDTIRKEFFDLLASKAAAIDSRVSSLIYSYGRKLASFDSRSQSFMNWLGFLENGSSVQSSREYEKIDQILKNTKKKIIVTIDDLDRLYPTEIMEVLKLIRNTANFSNIFYLVGYDKGYVQQAINTLTEIGASDFLDKIFQLEIPLPKCDEDDLLITLRNRLKTIVSAQHYDIFDDIIIPNDFRNRYEKSYSTILRQGRDITRFLNGFKIVYDLIGEEVDFESLILLELIKFRYPMIYRLIYRQSDLFLEESPVRSTHEQYLSPRLVKSKENSSDEVSLFKTHLEEIEWLTTEDISLLNGLFMKLFKGNRYYRPEAKNSISYPLYFDVYFQYQLSPKNLSDKDFKMAITSDRMQEFMKYCTSNGLHKQLMIRLMQEDISTNRRSFEDHIRWIFIFGTTFVEKEGRSRFDYDALANKIYNYDNIITRNLYKNDIRQYKEFLIFLFNTALPPFLFVNELLYYLKKKGDNFVISIDEMVEYQYSYFTKMAESGHGLSENTLWLFWGARQNYEVEVNTSGAYHKAWRFEPRLIPKMKSYIASKDPVDFLKFSIEYEIHDRSHAYIPKHVLEIFDSPADYRALIADNELLNEDVKKEYLQFFDDLSLNNFEQYVDVEFKTALKKKDIE